MARRTAQQELENQMQKMKEMGVTMSFRPALGAPDSPSRPIHIIADAATAAGINEDTKENN